MPFITENNKLVFDNFPTFWFSRSSKFSILKVVDIGVVTKLPSGDGGKILVLVCGSSGVERWVSIDDLLCDHAPMLEGAFGWHRKGDEVRLALEHVKLEKAETSDFVPPRDAFACATVKAAPADAPTPAYPHADVVLSLFIRGLGVIEGVKLSDWDYIATALDARTLKGASAFNANNENTLRITAHTQCAYPSYTFSYRRKHVTLDWQDSRLGEIIKTIRRSLDAAERATRG